MSFSGRKAVGGRQQKNYLFLFPGMLAPHESLYVLTRYLRRKLPECVVAAVPLGLSVASFDALVEKAERHVRTQIKEETPDSIILFGHSHGGRVANALVARMQRAYLSAHIAVITAGTPMGRRPDYLPRFMKLYFRLSAAYRAWPPVNQAPNEYGFYSDADRVVIPEFAKDGYTGQLIELHGLSHNNLIAPWHIGPHLVHLLATLMPKGVS